MLALHSCKDLAGTVGGEIIDDDDLFFQWDGDRKHGRDHVLNRVALIENGNDDGNRFRRAVSGGLQWFAWTVLDIFRFPNASATGYSASSTITGSMGWR